MAATASSQDAAPRASAAGDHLHIAIPHAPAAETVVPALGGAVVVAAFEKEDSTHSDSTAATLPSDVDDQAGAAAKSGKAAAASPGAAAGDAAGEGDNHVQHEAWRRWVVLFVSAMGVFMATVSTSALVIAFPTIIKELRVPIATMMWILLVPLLMICAVVPIAGKLGDVFGQAALYKFGYITFVLACLGAGFGPSDDEGVGLLIARIVSGFGSAFLFTNSGAILTDAFAPYGQVGLAQGVFQLTSALGSILGPLIGGALAESDWRWIFWFNVPIGGVCWLLAVWAVKNTRKMVQRTWMEHVKRFDWIGAIFCMLGLILLLLAMIQGVSPDPVLSQTGPIAGLIVAGCVSGIIFIVDQFYAVDPLITPSVFGATGMKRTFTITTLAGTAMSFGRQSITYNMIFYLQGPHGMDPLQAGIRLIPYGVGVMIAGFAAGALADKIGVRNMATVGPLITVAGSAGLATLDKHSSEGAIGGLLFVAGFGAGLFNSPNAMANMLSVRPQQRGTASAVSMLTMMFCAMLGIVITFGFVLNSMDQQTLFILFIYGGEFLSDSSVNDCLKALRNDYWIVIAMCLLAAALASQIPGDFKSRPITGQTPAATTPAAPIDTKEQVKIELAQIQAEEDAETAAAAK